MLSIPVQAAESATPEPSDAPPTQYVLGASLASSPAYSGASERKIKVRPSWAVQWGRVRFSTAEAAELLSNTTGNTGSGMMADLAQQGQWSLSAGLRTDNGRNSSVNPALLGLPSIAPTVRGRLVGGYRLTPEWSATAGFSQDLLGRRGGMTGALDIGWRTGPAHGTVWSAGAGISAGNRLFMNTMYGVPVGSAIAPTGFSAAASLRDAHASIGMRTPIAPQWFWFSSVSLARQLGDAARSPLTREPFGFVVTGGLAYRCCQP
jgi:outer membrane scaffolding protein for murein synthesis (MipA/OmpV family)